MTFQNPMFACFTQMNYLGKHFTFYVISLYASLSILFCFNKTHADSFWKECIGVLNEIFSYSLIWIILSTEIIYKMNFKKSSLNKNVVLMIKWFILIAIFKFFLNLEMDLFSQQHSFILTFVLILVIIICFKNGDRCQILTNN